MITMAHPIFLILLPLPWLLPYLSFIPKMTISPGLWVPFYELALKSQGGSRLLTQRNFSFNALYLAWILMVLALSNPQWIGPPVQQTNDTHALMMALDISGSMSLDDMTNNGQPITRLELVKNAAKQFIDKRTGDSIGLILFGTKAYLMTPITQDLHHISQRIEDATVGLAGNSTSIGDAIGLAIKRLRHLPAQNRVLILLTDGVNNSGLLNPIKAAEMAKSDGIKIYTIGLGQDPNNQFHDPFFGLAQVNDLDEKTLQKIANITSGKFFLANDEASLIKIYDTINQLETIKSSPNVLHPQIDYYPWLAALALGVLLYHLMRWGIS